MHHSTISFLLFFTQFVTPFHILIYSPRMMQSHVNFVAGIANLLAERGHHVTVLDSILRYDIGNGLSDHIHNIIQVKQSPQVDTLLNSKSIPTSFWNLKNNPKNQNEAMQKVGKLYLAQCEHLIKNSTVLEEMKNLKFDFGIHEVFDTCGIGIFHKIGIAKSAIISSAGRRDIVNEILGISGALDDASILSDYGSEIPFWEVRRNVQFHDAWRTFFETQSKKEEKIFGIDFEETLRNITNLMLLNSHELVDTSRSWARKIFEIGGISLKSPKPLDEEYTKLLSKFEKNVLVSFGTTAPSYLMPAENKNALLEAFQKFPNILFIWKYEVNDTITSQSYPNVIFKRFVPQLDLLNSRRIDLFITHCGQNSLIEILTTGTRIIGVPLFGDQHRNARMISERGLVEYLDKRSLKNSRSIENAIRNGLRTNEELSKNLLKIKENLKNLKKTAENTVIFAIEHTFSSEFPPNFQNAPRLWPANRILLLINTCIYSILALLISFIFSQFFRLRRHN